MDPTKERSDVTSRPQAPALHVTRRRLFGLLGALALAGCSGPSSRGSPEKEGPSGSKSTPPVPKREALGHIIALLDGWQIDLRPAPCAGLPLGSFEPCDLEKTPKVQRFLAEARDLAGNVGFYLQSAPLTLADLRLEAIVGAVGWVDGTPYVIARPELKQKYATIPRALLPAPTTDANEMLAFARAMSTVEATEKLLDRALDPFPDRRMSRMTLGSHVWEERGPDFRGVLLSAAVKISVPGKDLAAGLGNHLERRHRIVRGI